MKIVLDTNVLVAGLLSPFGTPAQVLQLILAGKVGPCVDARILTEYRDVLTRPKFGFDADAVADLMEFVGQIAETVAPTPWGLELPDPADAMFLEVAYAGQADYLVTGNLKHFPARKRCQVKVVPPAQFIDEPAVKTL
jgi:putative PIN family toxin of toxin-antitoxin system